MSQRPSDRVLTCKNLSFWVMLCPKLWTETLERKWYYQLLVCQRISRQFQTHRDVL